MKLNEYPDPENLYKCAKNTDALLKAEAIKPVYEPPITLYMNEIQTQIEDNCLKAVQSYGFNVDKDELKKALDYDRGQYDKGYVNGYLTAKRTYERQHGEWLVTERGYECNKCREVHLSDYPFCHMCGADMRKETKHDSN